VTPEKQRQKLAGQSAIAQKVFQSVPVADAWSHHQIAAEMRRSVGSAMDIRTLLGCLNTLVDAGLVRRQFGATFIRAAVSAAAEEKQKEIKPMAGKKEPAAAPVLSSALDVLGNLSQRLRDLAQELDAAALVIAEGQQADAQLAERYKQIQSLLRQS
jgi:hypothetical protein